MSGAETTPQDHLNTSSKAIQQQQQHPSKSRGSRQRNRKSPDGKDREFPTTKANQNTNRKMGGADDRSYYGTTRAPPPTARDYHYGGGAGGMPADHHFRSGSSSSRQSRNSSSASSNYHVNSSSSGGGAGSGSGSSHSRRTGSGASSREYYLDKSSPYHHGGGSRVSRAQAVAQAQQDYGAMLIRQQEYEHRMTHHSGSRSDLLEHDHTAAIYEAAGGGLGGQYHAAAAAAAAAAGNNQPYTFVRMCDGKFVRTTIPIHDFDALDSTLVATTGSGGGGGSNYYRGSHTMRRPSKRSVVASAADAYACCPRDDLAAASVSAGRTTQSYATLRGRKWVEKQRAGCSSGVGDNFGRVAYLDDSRSMNSFSDDLALTLPPREGGGVHAGSHMNVIMTSSAMSGQGMRGGNMSRSTDRNLDNLGLSDDDIFLPGGGSGKASAEEVLTLLTREPPDGKEKPEPSKSSLLKIESTLSRKSSKCDLLSSANSSSNSPQVIQQQQQQQPQQPQQQPAGSGQESRSEATSVCGDNSSVLSGLSGAIPGSGHGVQPGGGAGTSGGSNKMDSSSSKRDSLSGSIMGGKNNEPLYIEAAGSGSGVPPPGGPLQPDDIDVSGKDW